MHGPEKSSNLMSWIERTRALAVHTTALPRSRHAATLSVSAATPLPRYCYSDWHPSTRGWRTLATRHENWSPDNPAASYAITRKWRWVLGIRGGGVVVARTRLSYEDCGLYRAWFLVDIGGNRGKMRNACGSRSAVTGHCQSSPPVRPPGHYCVCELGSRRRCS